MKIATDTQSNSSLNLICQIVADKNFKFKAAFAFLEVFELQLSLDLVKLVEKRC